MMRALPLALLLSVGVPTAQAHDLQYTVTGGQAVVVRLFYPDNTAFSFESYEIYPRDGKLPVQVGRTDAHGRIAFLPDRAGQWRIRTFSADGHGLDFRLTTDATAGLSGSDKPFYERHARIVVGVALILGLFGLLNLYIRKRKRP
ncbi:MAG TPA: ABC transporter permease [Thiobacillaceae bacterium]|nr:ABC transporter permease [Thiobacillaceae bacterium]HNU63266.1 ABC transporter permease [Thiobacillaceae bacterium]